MLSTKISAFITFLYQYRFLKIKYLVMLSKIQFYCFIKNLLFLILILNSLVKNHCSVFQGKVVDLETKVKNKSNLM